MCIQGTDREELRQPPFPLRFTEWSRDQGVRGGASTGSLSIVLESSIVNTVNLFTGNRGALIASRATQNPLPLLGDKTLQSEPRLSMPTDLQSAPPIVPQ